MKNLVEYAKEKHPTWEIVGFSHEDFCGYIVWMNDEKKSTHIESQMTMLMDKEDIRHHSEMDKIRSQIEKATEVLK